MGRTGQPECEGRVRVAEDPEGHEGPSDAVPLTAPKGKNNACHSSYADAPLRISQEGASCYLIS